VPASAAGLRSQVGRGTSRAGGLDTSDVAEHAGWRTRRQRHDLHACQRGAEVGALRGHSPAFRRVLKVDAWRCHRRVKSRAHLRRYLCDISPRLVIGAAVDFLGARTATIAGPS
jgi:hypothetical protein